MSDEQKWASAPWQDSCQATLGHAWATFTTAVICAVLGHRGTIYPPDDTSPSWRTCDRCNGKWERQAAHNTGAMSDPSSAGVET